MNEAAYLPSIEINPPVSARASVIWLHGLGADGNDFVPLVPELQLPNTLNIRFVFPHAPIKPVTINNGYEMRAWYDITALSAAGIIDQAGITDSVQQIERLIAREEALGISSDRIILAGFSQGAVIALTTMLTISKRLCGVIALSGYLPNAQELLKENPVNQQTPIFMAHGTEDNIVPYALGKAAYVALKEKNDNVKWHSYPMPHSVCNEEVRDLSQWIQVRLS